MGHIVHPLMHGNVVRFGIIIGKIITKGVCYIVRGHAFFKNW